MLLIVCHSEMVNCFYWVMLTFTLRTLLVVTLLHLEIFLTTAVWLFVLVNHLILLAIVLMLSLQGKMTI